eukprot:4718516-Pyramimonas_sp.AAC.1
MGNIETSVPCWKRCKISALANVSVATDSRPGSARICKFANLVSNRNCQRRSHGPEGKAKKVDNLWTG